MRSHLPEFSYRKPSSLDEALNALAEQPGYWQPIAGGTDLMVLLEFGQLNRLHLLDVNSLEGLRFIQSSDEHMEIGALTTYDEISGVEFQDFPNLVKAARETGGVAIQNRGTIGGNIINASPAADSPPALLVYDARLKVVSEKGERLIPYKNFHTAYKAFDLREDELLKSIILPRPSKKGRHFYRKVGTRRMQAISKVLMAGFCVLEQGVIEDLRIAFGSVGPKPILCRALTDSLRGKVLTRDLLAQAQNILQTEISPIADIRSTGEYRLQVAKNLLSEFLGELCV